MKIKLVLLSGLMLLQSCYSYKELESRYEGLEPGENYKLNHEEYGKYKRGSVIGVNDSVLTYKIRNGRIDKLSLDGIQQIKKGKFSLGKTIVLPVSITAGTFGLFKLAGGQSGVGLGNIDLGF
ncbi:hypothetical protein [Maribacter aestuarii]|uniref:hypothetical protein n=1 Tax=Maribacter aestuarii TaxID=1130723 RepID=UPI0025A55DD4|nr:hypothetical protein [Maribacter aestuarii]